MKSEFFYRHERWLNLLLRCEIPWFHEWLLNRVYDQDFYAEMAPAKAASARAFAQVVAANMSFQSLFDIGCGSGVFLAEFHRLGKDVAGCEASRDAVTLASKDFPVFVADATRPIPIDRRHDLVLCIEVAEHIGHRHSRQLVENCAHLGAQVLFTAAPPGQKGIGHINLHAREFWQELFRREGFVLDAPGTERIREQLRQQQVLAWLYNNLMIFVPAHAKP